MSDTKNPWKNLRSNVSARRKARYSRQHTAAEKARSESRFKGRLGGSGFWKNELKIIGPYRNKKTNVLREAVPVVVRLVPGEYEVPNHVALEFEEFIAGEILPNYMRIEYRHGTVGKFGVDVPDTRDTEDGKDLSIYLMDEGDDTINPRLINYYNVLDLGSWHKVPTEEEYQDKSTGEVKTRQGFEWKRCEGKQCQYCDQGLEKIHGRAGYYRLTPAFETTLNSIANTIGQFCTCGTPTPLQAFSAQCSECGHVLAEADFDETTGEIEEPITPKRIGALYDKHDCCPGCGTQLREIPEEGQASIVEELNCEGCATPNRASIYDADLALVKEGEAPKTILKLDTSKFNARGFRIRAVPEALQESAVVHDFGKNLPNSLSYVAKRIEIDKEDNPYYEPPEGSEER